MSGGASDLFVALTPDRVLEAVEAGGLAVRPVCYPLNSFENRVYEVELADRSRVVAKFYRPGRWSPAQILEEHRFLKELDGEEIPVCAARPFPGGGTLRDVAGIHYAIFDRRGGRAPDELTPETARRLGQLAARVHVVGARRPAAARPRLSGADYVVAELPALERSGLVPARLVPRWLAAALLAAEGAAIGGATGFLEADPELGVVPRGRAAPARRLLVSALAAGGAAAWAVLDAAWEAR